MVQDCRDFLKGTTWMGLAAVAAGCQFDKIGFGVGAPMGIEDIGDAGPQMSIGNSKEG